MHLIKMKLMVVVILVLAALSYTECVPLRRKRFILHQPVMTPTTNLPNNFPNNGMGLTGKPNGPRTVLTGPSLSASVQAQCPVKRSSEHHRVLLDDRLMRQLYLELIGNMDTSMVAGDLLEAETNFKHIHPSPYRTTKQKHMKPILGKIKSALMKDIKTFNDWYNSVINANTTAGNMSMSQRDDTKADPILEILEKSGITLEELKGILQLTHDIEEIKHYNYRGNYRSKRSITEAEISRVEYCTKRGSPVDGGYLRMCSACALTTQLPSDVFPRYINEVRCDQTDCDCFTISGTSYGRCKQMIQNIKMLRRKTSGCRMLINNGTKIFLDDWELYNQPVHVGCECVFDRRSQYAQFLAKP